MQDLDCPVCFAEVMCPPTVLWPCGHMLCGGCVRQCRAVRQEKALPFICPLCNGAVTGQLVPPLLRSLVSAGASPGEQLALAEEHILPVGPPAAAPASRPASSTAQLDAMRFAMQSAPASSFAYQREDRAAVMQQVHVAAETVRSAERVVGRAARSVVQQAMDMFPRMQIRDYF